MADSGDVGEEEVHVKLTMEQIEKLIGEDDPELGLEAMDPNRKELAMLAATRRIRTRPQESLQVRFSVVLYTPRRCSVRRT
jgi:hypothetical protein